MPEPVDNPGPKNLKVDKFWRTLTEQLINSAIVGGIAGISALAASPEASFKVGLIAFGITALTEIRKYRKI